MQLPSCNSTSALFSDRMNIEKIPTEQLHEIYELAQTRIQAILQEAQEAYHLKIPDGNALFFMLMAVRNRYKIQDIFLYIIKIMLGKKTTPGAKRIICRIMEGHNMLGSFMLRSELNMAYGALMGHCQYRRLYLDPKIKEEKRKLCCQKPTPQPIKEFKVKQPEEWCFKIDALLQFPRYNSYTNAIQQLSPPVPIGARFIVNKLLNRLSWDYIAQKKILERMTNMRYNFVDYMLSYQMINQYKIYYLYGFDKNMIEAYVKANRNNTDNIKVLMVLTIYNKFINKKYTIRHKYEVYHLLQYIILSTYEQFITEFQIYTEADLNELLKFIFSSGIYQYSQLEKKLQICKRLERSHFNLEFSERLKLTEVSHESLLQLFICTGSRLQMVGSDHDNYIIIRSRDDNNIHLGMVNEESLAQIDEMIIQCGQQGPCDVILCSQFDHKEIEEVEMSWLNYRKIGDVDRITLHYPAELVSASLHNVRIRNLQECENLKNLYSQDNVYKQRDFSGIYNLKRLFTQNDTFDSDRDSMLKYLFKNNKLTYVYVRNGKNVVQEMTLYRNIEDLKFMFVECLVDRSFMITLDCHKEFPKKLLVFEVQITHREKNAFRKQGEGTLFGSLEGPEYRVKYLENQIIHNIHFDEYANDEEVEEFEDD